MKLLQYMKNTFQMFRYRYCSKKAAKYIRTPPKKTKFCQGEINMNETTKPIIREMMSESGRRIILVNEPSPEIMAKCLKRIIDKKLLEAAKEKAGVK